MPKHYVDFITSWMATCSRGMAGPGRWGREGPDTSPGSGTTTVTYLMGANTYRLMSGFAAGETPEGTAEFRPTRGVSRGLTRRAKLVFSSSLEDPLTWANTTLVRGDAVHAVRG